jgi:pimeloyl-ACP methyl ester carboxylesterase
MQQEVPQLRFATTRLGSGPEVHYAEQGDPGGEPIVFLPAYTDSWFSYSRVLPLLPLYYHAYALDQRGHGDSERPACCYTIEDFATDVVAFLDVVGAERATLVGHSASCFTARRVAEVHPERVARLMLLGSPGSLGDNQEELELQTAVRALEDPVPVQFARELQGAAAHVALPESFFERIVADSLRLPARVWKRARWMASSPSMTRRIWGGSPRRRCSSGESGTGSCRGRRRTIWRSRSLGPGWSCTRRPATAPTGSAPSGSPPTWTPSCVRRSRLARSRPLPRGTDAAESSGLLLNRTYCVSGWLRAAVVS